MNKDSDNLCAEMLLYAMAFNDSGAPASAENGIAVIEKLIDEIGFDPKDYSLADGSGVSRYNLLSPELILEVLKDIYYNKSELYEEFYNSLAIGGVDGTLKKRMQEMPLLGNVHAKTGTLQGVSALSGYLTSNNKQLIAFSILIQNYTGKNSAAHYFLDTICEYIANSN
jgi:D-alanyl-D-alanine carboxypeptidase/D-alanyl-D-alanine-endopeptidase (penicillin-binding protein 4)